MLKIPYGISDFKQLATENYHYVDRTSYLEKLEQLSTKYHFFLRPRRFGKSLFISTLQYYYGIQYQTQFEQLFGQYYIGQHPTPLANSYLVLRFNFSAIDTSTNEKAYQGFLNSVKYSVLTFFSVYKTFFKSVDQHITAASTPQDVMLALYQVMQEQEVKHVIYLLIDEYDHFTNEILAFRFEEFKNIVGKNGWVRKFYESLKVGTDSGKIARMFVTGVTSITLDSLTSGFNNSTDISRRLGFENMMGFVTEEVLDILRGLGISETELPAVISHLKKWYNGYRFNKHTKQRVYNSQMVLYFAYAYQENMDYPDELLDVNIASDYSKIRNMFRIAHKERENLEVLREIIKKDEVTAYLIQRYNLDDHWGKDQFVSLLYYLGFLTIKAADFGGLVFQAPNYVIRQLYFQYFTRIILEDANIDQYDLRIRDKVLELAKYNNINPIIDLTQSTLTQLSAHYDRAYFNEGHVKAIFVSWFHATGVYHIYSELEVKKSKTKKGRIDLLLARREPFMHVPYQFIFELKYLKQNQAHQVEEVKEEAIQQLKAYLADEKIKGMTELKAYVVIFVVNKAVVIEL